MAKAPGVDETAPSNSEEGITPPDLELVKRVVVELVKDVEPDKAFAAIGDVQKIITKDVKGESVTVGYRDEGVENRRHFFSIEWIDPKDHKSRLRGLRRFKETYNLDDGMYKKVYKDDTKFIDIKTLDYRPIGSEDEKRMQDLLEAFSNTPIIEESETVDDKDDKKEE